MRSYAHATLGRNWKGGDEGLAHFRDIYGLEEFYVKRAGISDQGMKHIGGLKSMHTLVLIDTKVTDAGLKHLEGATKLTRLILEGPFGGKEFGDPGLKNLTDVPLTSLTLYGWNYTDAGLQSLRTHKSLRSLTLAGTAITDEAIEQVKQQQSRLRIRVRFPDL